MHPHRLPNPDLRVLPPRRPPPRVRAGIAHPPPLVPQRQAPRVPQPRPPRPPPRARDRQAGCSTCDPPGLLRFLQRLILGGPIPMSRFDIRAHRAKPRPLSQAVRSAATGVLHRLSSSGNGYPRSLSLDARLQAHRRSTWQSIPVRPIQVTTSLFAGKSGFAVRPVLREKY